MWILTNLFSYLVTNFNWNYHSCWNYLPSASVRTRQKSSSERFKADGGWRTRKADDVCVNIWTLLLKVMSAFISISVRGRCVRMADDVCAYMWTQPKSQIVNQRQNGPHTTAETQSKRTSSTSLKLFLSRQPDL